MKIVPVGLLLSIYCAVFTLLASADQQEKSRHMSTEDIVHFSLSSLKESLQATLRQNDRLTFEIGMLRRDISSLQREQDILIQKKAALSDAGSVSRHPSNVTRDLQGSVDLSSRARRTQELIDAFERDIVYLRENIRVLEDKLDKGRFEDQKKMLLSRREEIRKSINAAQKRLRRLTEQGAQVFKGR
jgi:hypothetical protein